MRWAKHVALLAPDPDRCQRPVRNKMQAQGTVEDEHKTEHPADF